MCGGSMVLLAGVQGFGFLSQLFCPGYVIRERACDRLMHIEGQFLGAAFINLTIPKYID
jgi:hypothetical protein